MEKKLEIEGAIQILKPANTVYEAIVDPKHMTNYFISKSTGKMEDGKTLTWKFPEFEIEFPIHVEKLKQDKYI